MVLSFTTGPKTTHHIPSDSGSDSVSRNECLAFEVNRVSESKKVALSAVPSFGDEKSLTAHLSGKRRCPMASGRAYPERKRGTFQLEERMSAKGFKHLGSPA